MVMLIFFVDIPYGPIIRLCTINIVLFPLLSSANNPQKLEYWYFFLYSGVSCLGCLFMYHFMYSGILLSYSAIIYGAEVLVIYIVMIFGVIGFHQTW